MTSVFVKQISRDICAVTAVINHTRPSAQVYTKLSFGWRLSSPSPCRLYVLQYAKFTSKKLSETLQRSLVQVIILLSAYKASSLSTSLKSMNEIVCRVVQRPFACMHTNKLFLVKFFLRLRTEQYLILLKLSLVTLFLGFQDA